MLNESGPGRDWSSQLWGASVNCQSTQPLDHRILSYIVSNEWLENQNTKRWPTKTYKVWQICQGVNNIQNWDWLDWTLDSRQKILCPIHILYNHNHAWWLQMTLDFPIYLLWLNGESKSLNGWHGTIEEREKSTTDIEQTYTHFKSVILGP